MPLLDVLTRLASRCAALFAVTAGLAAAHSAPAESVAVDADFNPAAQAGSLVEIAQDRSTLKGLKRVAVTQFNIDFVTQDSVSAETSGFASAGRASVTGFYALVGVAEPEFQRLAERAYAEFVAGLRAEGLEVVSPAELAAAPSWQRLVASSTPLPLRSESMLTVGPAGMVIYGSQKARTQTGQPGAKGLLGGLAAMSSITSAIGAQGDLKSLREELGNATLLEVSLRLHFAQLASGNRGFFGRLSDTAKVSAKAHPIVSRAELNLQGEFKTAQLLVKVPLLLDANAFSEVRKPAATTGEVAGAVATGLLRMAIGNKDSHSSEKFEIVSDPERYGAVVGAGLAQTSRLLIARMASER